MPPPFIVFVRYRPLRIQMESVQHKCTPDNLLGKALEYAYKLWPRARRYADDGRYQLDNNPVERGQRPTVMGRKNYLFSKTNEGAVDNAVIYSLLGSCEIANVNPLKWMGHALDNLYPGISEDELTKLLPCNFIESRRVSDGYVAAISREA